LRPSRAIEHWLSLAEQFDVHPNQITSWEAQLEEGAADVFGPGGGNGGAQPAVNVKSLHAKIGRWRTIFGRSAQQTCFSERKAMIDRAHDLPIMKQAPALTISRGSIYYLPRSVSAADLALMRRIDELHLEFPSPAVGCCATCWLPRGSKIGAVGMSRR
jgi:putative transposase